MGKQFYTAKFVISSILVLLVGGLDYEQFSIAGDIDFFIRISRLKEFSAYRSKEIIISDVMVKGLGDRGDKKSS